MKVTPEQLQVLRGLIEPLDTAERRSRYLAGDYPRADRTKDVDMRYRWDLLWEADAYGAVDSEDLTSDHIDTALRRIVAPLHA